MTVTRKPFWLGAEPNWAILDLNDGSAWGAICCYCYIATKATVAVTTGDALADWCEDGDSCLSTTGFAGYQWDADGACWMIHGPEAEYHWWEIDDLLWGFMETSVFAVVKADHTVKTRAEFWDEVRGMSFVYPEEVAEAGCTYWNLV